MRYDVVVSVSCGCRHGNTFHDNMLRARLIAAVMTSPGQRGRAAARSSRRQGEPAGAALLVVVGRHFREETHAQESGGSSVLRSDGVQEVRTRSGGRWCFVVAYTVGGVLLLCCSVVVYTVGVVVLCTPVLPCVVF